MTARAPLPNTEHPSPHARAHGSSLHTLPDPLDDERAASMADEGGAAGAFTDAIEQAAADIADIPVLRRARGLPRWVGWAALASAGAAILVWAVWFRRR